MTTQRITLLFTVSLLLLLTYWLGARGLAADSIWWDEYYSVYNAGGAPFTLASLPAVWQRVATEDPFQSPGHYLLLWLWGGAVGWREPFALRALSLLAGMLALAFTARLAADLTRSPFVAAAAVAVLGTSAFYIHFLHELRMSVFFVLWTALLVWAYLRAVRAASRHVPAYLALVFVGAVGLLYTHYLAALPLAALAVWHALAFPPLRRLRLPRRAAAPASARAAPASARAAHHAVLSTQRWWALVAALALAALTFVPWLPVLAAGVRASQGNERLSSDSLDAVQATQRFVALFSNGQPLVFAGVLVLALIYSVRQRDPQVRRGLGAAWCFALGTLAALLLANALVPVMLEGRVRYLIGGWALWSVLVAAGAAALRAPLRYGLVALWMLLGVRAVFTGEITRGLDGGVELYPVEQAADGTRRYGQPGDLVVNYLPDGVPTWRYGGVNDYYFFGQAMNFRTLQRWYGDGETEQYHRELLSTLDGDDHRVWLAHDRTQPPFWLDAFRADLDGRYDVCAARSFGSIDLTLYTDAPACCWTPDAPPLPIATFGGTIALTGLTLTASANTLSISANTAAANMLSISSDTVAALPASYPVRAAQYALVSGWQPAPSVAPDTYSYGLHVYDAAGALVAQTDAGLPAQTFACRALTLDLSGLPVGEYRLAALVYDWQSGRRLEVAPTTPLPDTAYCLGDGCLAPDDTLPLATLTIAPG